MIYKKYAVLLSPTANVGDDIQTLAVINFAGYKENWDNRYDVNREEQSLSRFNSVMKFFTELGVPVSHFSKSIDEDFCYGAFSHNLITTTGGFSRLIKKISNAQPPNNAENI